MRIKAIHALAGLLVLYAAFGMAYALRTPAWQNPDEPAHYNYVVQLAEGGCCPVIAAGDWDQAYLSRLTAARFAPDLLGGLETIRYENHQPPLYYLLAVVPYQIGGLVGIRLFSLLLGAGVIGCAFAVGRALLPARLAVAVGAAALVALVPQHMAIMASANNDALAELMIGLTLLALLTALRSGRRFWLVGLAMGVCFLTKTTTYGLAGVVPLAIAADALVQRAAPRVVIGRLAAFALPALAVGALWWLRNLGVYGGTDFLGLAAHDAVVVGQLRRADHVAAVGVDAYWRAALITTFNSFWGQFGWMALPLDGRIYSAIGVALAAAGVGWAAALGGQRAAAPESQGGRWRAGMMVALAALAAVALAQFAYYNLTFVQFQGRYLFPALIPVGLALAFGWEALARRIGGGRAAWLSVGIPLLLVPLNAYVLWRVLPGLAA